jgi:DNA-binding HxlR family transcriptional regulator
MATTDRTPAPNRAPAAPATAHRCSETFTFPREARRYRDRIPTEAPAAIEVPEARRTLRGDQDLIEGADRTLGVLHGKWKVHLLFVMARGVHRHSRLLECLPGVSKKVMTESLRALERDGLVVRRIFAEVPARVEYSLTPLGWTLTEPLVALADWGSENADAVADARARQHLESSNGHNPLS